MKFLCISTYFKGGDFLESCKKEGNTVYLLTRKKLENEPWPWHAIDDVYYMEDDLEGEWNLQNVVNALSYIMRSIKFDRFVALDDFDVEKVAYLREYFRSPGMGFTTARYFRDKLSMREKAYSSGIPNPEFTALFHDQDITDYATQVPAPWILKPRAEASAIGIKKIHTKEELWDTINELGDLRRKYLLERFTPGDVFHVDSISANGKVVFTRASRYLDTPFEVAHEGGIFRSQTLEIGSKEEKELTQLNARVLESFGMQYSASHSEYIRSHETGEYLFLETSSRVGGAHLAEMVEAASGINLWREWARLETAVATGEEYKLPETRENNAGIIVSLSRYLHPDTSSFTDPEICWRLNKDWHIGMIIRSENHNRVRELLDQYVHRIKNEFHASLPAIDELHN